MQFSQKDLDTKMKEVEKKKQKQLNKEVSLLRTDIAQAINDGCITKHPSGIYRIIVDSRFHYSPEVMKETAKHFFEWQRVIILKVFDENKYFVDLTPNGLVII